MSASVDLRVILNDPRAVQALDERGWESLVGQARGAGLLARLHYRLDMADMLSDVPQAPRRHLEAIGYLAQRHAQSARSEVGKVLAALKRLEQPVILLKGAAYLMADMPLARGRLFSDIDILLPRVLLPEAEAALLTAGWASTHCTAYDQRYYRRWMHELPPLQHMARGTSVDVHHTLFPLTGRLRIDINSVLEATVPIPGCPGARQLCTHDQILHATIHLLYGEEFERGLRDLSDIDLLLQAGSADPDFWEGLLARAATLGLQRPLYYSINCCQRLLATPVPADVMAVLDGHAPAAPLRQIMNALFDSALAPPDLNNWRQAAARLLLFIRGHWFKMPLYLLVYHLGRKAIVGDGKEESEKQDQAP